MRDINRIDSFLQELGKYWKKVPDWRFGQFIYNVLESYGKDPFYLEEDEFINNVIDPFFNDIK